MCFGNLSPIASRTSTSDLPTRSLAAANPARSGTVSKSQTMMLGFMPVEYVHGYVLEAARRSEIAISLRSFVELPVDGVPSRTSARARYQHNCDRYYLRP